MKQLVRLRADETVPQPLRDAAQRLSTKVDRDHRLPFENDALDDAGAIIEWVLDKGTNDE